MKAGATGKWKKAKTDATEPIWNLRLYVAGQTRKSITAFATLKQICDEHLAGKYRIEVIDLVKNPHLAKGDQIIALPTLVRKLPEPIKKIIGDLADTERVLVGLDVREGQKAEDSSQKPGDRSQKPGAIPPPSAQRSTKE